MIVASRVCVTLAIGTLFFAGCSPAPKGQLATVGVSGIVKVDGKPSGRAMLQFTPDGPGLPGATAIVGDDGRFVVQTYAPGDGIPPGSYSVALGPDFTKFMPVPAVDAQSVKIEKADSNLELNFKATGAAGGGLPPPGMEKK